MTQIHLKEEFNHLKIKTPYAPIVCGNKNYSISIDFSNDWSNIQNKIAVFVIGSKKTAVEFSGDTFAVPALPNANHAKLIIMSAESESEAKVTSTFELNLKPTLHADDMKEFKPLSNYAQEMISKINGLVNGTVKAKHAELADTATISLNSSNPNLLINGDFKINQRGSSTYTCTKNEYTVDRWLGSNNLTVTKTASGVTLSNTSTSASTTFVQKLEELYSSFAGQSLTLSAKIAGEIYFLTTTIPATEPTTATTLKTATISTGVSLVMNVYPNSILGFGIKLSPEATTTLTYLKLEVGTSPTIFTPRPYAEELALCQRYFWCNNQDFLNYNRLGIGVCQTTTRLDFEMYCPVQMRVKPTISIIDNSYNVRECNENIIRVADFTSGSEIDFWISNLSLSRLNGSTITITSTSSDLTVGHTCLITCSSSQIRLQFDAEIY